MLRRALAGLAAVGILASAASADAFCRTTTVKIPAGYDPSAPAAGGGINGCWTQGLPLYWANACVSYDVQQDASQYVPYAVAANGIADAFAKWTATTCLTNAEGPGRVSIDVRDFGPVACSVVEYNQYGPNQHAIIFRDSAWPYEDSSNTLALTTVTYDLDTGEIYDADMEINTATQPLSITANVPPNGYDFESIVTHETGHFLGMAHATDIHATMYAHYTEGEQVMRLLTADDIDGICTIYPPNGLRSVATAAMSPPTGSTSGSGSGATAGATGSSGNVTESACDPTPRHGFTTLCEGSGSGASGGCSVASGEPLDIPAWPFGGVSVGLLITSGAFRRLRLRRASSTS